MDRLSTHIKATMTIIGEAGKVETGWITKLTDHARFNKADVCYDERAGKLVVQLKRYPEKTKARKKILGFVIWRNAIPPTKECVLTIKDIQKCEIKNSCPTNSERQEVISGGLIFNGEKIYMGSFCHHENPYEIQLEVKKINVELSED